LFLNGLQGEALSPLLVRLGTTGPFLRRVGSGGRALIKENASKIELCF